MKKHITFTLVRDVQPNYCGGNALQAGQEVHLEINGLGNNGFGPQNIAVRPRRDSRSEVQNYTPVCFVKADELLPATSKLVEIRSGDAFQVYLKSDPSICSTGKTRVDALGNFLAFHGADLNVEIEVG